MIARVEEEMIRGREFEREKKRVKRTNDRKEKAKTTSQKKKKKREREREKNGGKRIWKTRMLAISGFSVVGA